MLPTKGGSGVRARQQPWLRALALPPWAGDFTALNIGGALCVHTEMITESNDFSALGGPHTSPSPRFGDRAVLG